MDTSAFFATINRRDSHSAEALAVLRSLTRARRPLVTTNFVVAETHAMLLSRHHQPAATQFLRQLDASSVVLERVSEGDESSARAIIYRYLDKQFSYTDATSFAVMERLGINEAFTFDRNFSQYGFRVSTP